MHVTCTIAGCDQPTDGYVCRDDATKLSRWLDTTFAVLNDPDTGLRATVGRLDHIAPRGGIRPAGEAEPWTSADGALRPTPLPVNLDAGQRADAAVGEIVGWARHIAEQRGRSPDRAGNGAATAARYVSVNLDKWLRHQREAEEAWPALEAAARTIIRVVEGPAPQELVGQCDCAAWLYAPRGATWATCRQCAARHPAAERWDRMWDDAQGRLVTAAEAVTLMLHEGLIKTRTQPHNLIRRWAARGHLTAHGRSAAGHPTYRYGDIADRMAAQQRDPATVTGSCG